MNVLFIGAHPDDADVWAAGTLLKCRKRGDSIFIAVMTSGNVGSDHYSREELAAVRQREQLAAADHYNAQVRFFCHEDNELAYTHETHMEVIDAIRWAQPNLVITHTPNDLAGDHGVTGYLVQKALISVPFVNMVTEHPNYKKRFSVFSCETYGGLNFEPNVYVDITDEFPEKLEIMKCHQSQLEYGWLEQVEKMAGFRGFQYGVQYAEAFRGFDFFGYMPNPRLLP